MTELQRDLSKEEMKAFGWIDDNGRINDRFKTPAGGASTAVWCATSPLLEQGGGVYCEDCNIAAALPANDPSFTGVRPWAIDPDAAQRLWRLSEALLDRKFAV
jgi:hypothetical protein